MLAKLVMLATEVEVCIPMRDNCLQNAIMTLLITCCSSGRGVPQGMSRPVNLFYHSRTFSREQKENFSFFQLSNVKFAIFVVIVLHLHLYISQFD